MSKEAVSLEEGNKGKGHKNDNSRFDRNSDNSIPGGESSSLSVRCLDDQNKKRRLYKCKAVIGKQGCQAQPRLTPRIY